MVITFSEDQAFAHLRDEGYVYTFRTSRRANPNVRTWAARGRGKPKEFDVVIREVREAAPGGAALGQYAPASGFVTTLGWKQAIRRQSDGAGLPDSGWYYLVVRTDDCASE
jgi:hypothetical protein